MSVNPGPPGKGAKRLSPDELAQEVASLLKEGAPGHPERRLRIDIVTVSRIVMALAVVSFGVGVAVAVPWIGGLAGFETSGLVIQGGPVVGCPGEIEIGEVFKGETVQVVGRTDDGLYFALRDERGPGDVVYVDAQAITDLDDADLLPPSSCEPRDEAAVLAAATTVGPGDPLPTTTAVTPTNVTGDTTTTAVAAGPDGRVGRPPRRGTATPGAPTTTTPPSTGPIGPADNDHLAGLVVHHHPAGPDDLHNPPAGHFLDQLDNHHDPTLDHHVVHYDTDDDNDPAHDHYLRGNDNDNGGDDQHRGRAHHHRSLGKSIWP